MIFDTIIEPLVCSVVRDCVAKLLADERDNQIEIAKKAGLSDEYIGKYIDFTIFPKRFTAPEYSDMPCVYIYFDDAKFPEEEQFHHVNTCKSVLNFEMYVAGTHVLSEDKKTLLVDGEEIAEDRLMYLLAQVYKVVSSEKAYYLGTEDLVHGVVNMGWKRIAAPQKENQTHCTSGILLQYSVSFEEPTKMLKGNKLAEICIALRSGDEFINPLLKIKIPENN